MSDTLLELRGVSKHFVQTPDLSTRIAGALRRKAKAKTDPHVVHAVDGVDLAIAKGEVVGLVGESGCGKSTLGRIVAGLYAPTSGTRLWKGREPLASSTRAPTSDTRQRLAVQMIFQDPYASLNPRMRVVDLIGEAPVAHGLWPSRERDLRAVDLLARVGLDASALRRYPHQFSGGQRARIGIAHALAVRPERPFCDTAVSAPHVRTQAQRLHTGL